MDALAALTPRLAVSVGDPRISGIRGWIAESWPNVICLDDARPDAGPLAGVEVGMQWAATLPLLVRAVDLPLAGPDVFRRLMDAWRSAAHRVDVVTAEAPDGRIQPLLSLWMPHMLPRLTAYLDQGGRSVLGLLDEAAVLPVRVDEQTVKNVNTRADLT
jgi:molybdopterin-guanine dinucleotide biosynthesis protein A